MSDRHYSAFWLGGGEPRDPEWYQREHGLPIHAAEALTMEQWLELPEAERCAVVAAYGPATPKQLYLTYSEQQRYQRRERLAAGDVMVSTKRSQRRGGT